MAAHSAAPPGLHWLVVWNRHAPQTEAGLVSYEYLLFRTRLARYAYEVLDVFYTWASKLWR